MWLYSSYDLLTNILQLYTMSKTSQMNSLKVWIIMRDPIMFCKVDVCPEGHGVSCPWYESKWLLTLFNLYFIFKNNQKSLQSLVNGLYNENSVI